MDEQTRQSLGKVAYERFAELRVARGSAMPPWTDVPGFAGQAGAPGLPEAERAVWAEVALAVAAHVPFEVDVGVLNAYADTLYLHDEGETAALNAAIEAAAATRFRVVKR